MGTRVRFGHSAASLGPREYGENLIKNFQAIEAQEIRITFHRAPAPIWVKVKSRQRNLLHRPFVRRRRASVIDHPVAGLIATKLRLTQKNHYVEGKLLHPGLIEEKQVASFGVLAITTDKFCVEAFETAGVSKLGEGA